MLFNKARSRNREAALATLVELLVQLVFVFTLVLVASEAMQGAPGERGWISPEAWRSLISIFDVDPSKIRDADKQAEEVKRKYLDLLRENKHTRQELEKCRLSVHSAEKELAACLKGMGRGPGLPTCRGANGEELVVLRAVITKEGELMVNLLLAGEELSSERGVDATALAGSISPARFSRAFLQWRQHGTKREHSCAYKATVEYDPLAPAGKYEPARRAVSSYFNFTGPPKQQ